MKFSAQWLREWVNPSLNNQALAAQLTMAGLEIESVLAVAGQFNSVVIGEVLAVEKHPDAEKLQVCQVKVRDTAETLQIVCGAANVRAGLKVAVAMLGAELPNGLVIKQAKLRGVNSQGMLCSTKELGLSETSEGIMELPADAPIGVNLREWLQLDDDSIDLHITPNRGDCLSIAGIAREVAVLNNLPCKPIDRISIAPVIDEQFSVSVEAPIDCPRYCGRIIRNINAQVQTPIWLRERLRRSGLRAIHPVVDVTNYVMLELGQPMHAFDVTFLTQQIIVRHAYQGEKITLLNDQEVQLNTNTLVIADTEKLLAIAGIMGGLTSSVTEATTDIFLESAFFAPLAIAGRARHYGLNTDSSYRFERGVDPQLPSIGLERATELLLEIVGGQAGPVIDVTHLENMPKQATILLRKQRIEKLLGILLADEAVETMLQQLGMHIKQHPQGWEVTVPGYRFDLQLEEDLLEELARIYGYNNLPIKTPQSDLAFLPHSEKEISLSRIRNLLVDQGYHEAITYSFIAPKLQKLLDPEAELISLLNPISADLSVMRSSLWPGLLEAVRYNQNRQQERVRLFESGMCFLQTAEGIQQRTKLAGVITGPLYSEQWSVKNNALDFFDIKKDVENLLSLTQEQNHIQFIKANHIALHPGQSSAIALYDQTIGYLGALHPHLMHELDLTGPVYLFELELDVLQKSQLSKFKSISKFPAIRRDLSFWIDQTIPVQQVLDIVHMMAGQWLQAVNVFDVYAGQSSEPDQQSLAISIILQHPERTLIDEEIEMCVSNILNELKQKFSVMLRD